MTSASSNQNDRVFFELTIRGDNGKFMPFGNTYSVPINHLTDISDIAIFQYLKNNYKAILFKDTDYFSIDCIIKNDYNFCGFPVNALQINLRRTKNNSHEVVYLFVRNIRVINYDWTEFNRK